MHLTRSSAGVGMVYKQEFDFIMDIKFPKEIGITQNPKMLRVGSFPSGSSHSKPPARGEFSTKPGCSGNSHPKHQFFFFWERSSKLQQIMARPIPTKPSREGIKTRPKLRGGDSICIIPSNIEEQEPRRWKTF